MRRNTGQAKIYGGKHIIMDETLLGKMQGKTVLLTGAGGGIGYEAARSFAFMGARVILAEIQQEKGKLAEKSINTKISGNLAIFMKLIWLTRPKSILWQIGFFKSMASRMSLLTMLL